MKESAYLSIEATLLMGLCQVACGTLSTESQWEERRDPVTGFVDGPAIEV